MADEVSPTIIKEEFTTARGLRHIAVFAVPMSLSQMTFSMVGIVSVYFAGSIGVTELGAASLTFSFLNATSFAVAAGFCGALETMFSHSFGENPDSKKYGTYAQRMVIILLLFSFPLAALFAYSESLLLFVGQTPGIARHVALFMQVGLIGLIPSMLMEVARRYYQAQHLTIPIMVSTALGAIVINPLAIMLFLYGFEVGYISLPIAWSILQILMLAGLVVYGQRNGLAARTWGGWNDDALKHWGPMLRLGFLSFLMMVSEFIVVEINSMSAGFLDEESLAAFSITGQMTFFTWNVTAGLFATMSVLVGTNVGAGQPLKAKKYAVLGTQAVLAVALFNALWMYLLGDVIAKAFTDSEEVRLAFKPIVPYACLFHVGDAIQSNTLGVFRGCGLQKRGAISVALSYAVVGMPLGWFLCFYLRWGVGMLWLGPAIGVLVVGWPLCFHGIFKTDWSQLTAHEEAPPAEDFA